MGKINFDATDFKESARKYRRELLLMPVIGTETTTKHMTLRSGIQYEEVGGSLDEELEVGPYNEDREDNSDITPEVRKLRTFFGSVVKNFSPNTVYKTIFGSSITKGESLKNVEVTRLVLAALAKGMSISINRHMWDAVRNDAGSKSKDLFNGFDTITSSEITAGTISKDKGNLYDFTSVLDATNTVDGLKALYFSCTDELQEVPTKLFIPKSVYNNYNDDYKLTTGLIPYNREFSKTFLEGSNDLCELVPLSNKKNSNYLHLTTKDNMLVGCDQESDLETLNVEKYKSFKLTFEATLFWGCDFRSLNSKKMIVGKLKTE